MRRIVVDDERIGPFVAQRAKCNFNPERDTAIGVIGEKTDLFQDPPVLGGVVFSGYTGVSCWLHMAGVHEKWATRDLLWVVFDYSFNLMGCARVFGMVEEANNIALKINMKLGFREVARIPGMFVSGDALVLSMERADCRWLGITPRTVRRLEH
jgi:RimJ/RimL family protein N-acetyltransferase